MPIFSRLTPSCDSRACRQSVATVGVTPVRRDSVRFNPNPTIFPWLASGAGANLRKYRLE